MMPSSSSRAVKAALKITLVDYENLFIVVDKPGNKGIAERFLDNGDPPSVGQPVVGDADHRDIALQKDRIGVVALGIFTVERPVGAVKRRALEKIAQLKSCGMI